MQRHVEHRFDRAFAWGIIALLTVMLFSSIGHGINAMAVYEEKGEVLSEGGGIGIGFMVVVTIASILFVVSAFDFIISENKFNEEDEKKLRVFAARCRGRGYSREQIHSILVKHGWNEREINSYLN